MSALLQTANPAPYETELLSANQYGKIEAERSLFYGTFLPRCSFRPGALSGLRPCRRLQIAIGSGEVHFPPYEPNDYSRTLGLDLVQEGRCELITNTGRRVVVTPGDLAIKNVQDTPSCAYYPARCYRELQIILHDGAAGDPGFSLLKEFGIAIGPWADSLLGHHTIWRGDPPFQRLIDDLQHCVDSRDTPAIKLKILELVVYANRNASNTGKTVYYTREQKKIAEACFQQITSHPEEAFSQRSAAQLYQVSVTSLNNYFRAYYGASISDWSRHYRMKLAAQFLTETSLPVIQIAGKVGYSNASKFSAAFSHIYGCTPKEFRKSQT